MPSNNKWFVRYVAQDQVLGWIDYLAHDFGDATLLNAVLSKMGSIYGTFPVVPQYLIEPTKTAKAMTRGWIFQESAFTALDGSVLEEYVQSMEELGAWYGGGAIPSWARADNAAEDIADATEGFHKLYERRCGGLMTDHKLAFTDTIAKVRAGGRGLAMPLVQRDFDMFVRELRDAAEPRPFCVVPTYDSYGENVAGTVLDAFGSLEFTKEEDCVVGTLAQIAQQYFGEQLQKDDYGAAQGLLRFLWEHQLDTTQRHLLADIRRTMPALTTCGLGTLYLRREELGGRDDELVRPVLEELRLLALGSVAQEAVFSGFSEWTTADGVLRLPEAARQQQGSLSADGINIVLLGDPVRGRVSHLCVSSNRIDGRSTLPQCSQPHEGAHCFGSIPATDSQPEPELESVSEGIPPSSERVGPMVCLCCGKPK